MPPPCHPRACPEDDTFASLDVLAASARPRVCERKGARALKHCDPVATNGQLFSARAGCVPCRGCGHIVSGLIGPARATSARASRVEDLELLRASFEERRCATGVRARCCHQCTAPVRGPGIRGELFLASDARDGTDICLNRAPPPPRKAAQLMRPSVDRGARSMGEAGRAGTRFWCCKGDGRVSNGQGEVRLVMETGGCLRQLRSAPDPKRTWLSHEEPFEKTPRRWPPLRLGRRRSARRGSRGETPPRSQDTR